MEAQTSKRQREVHSDGGLANAALARGDGDDATNALERLGCLRCALGSGWCSSRLGSRCRAGLIAFDEARDPGLLHAVNLLGCRRNCILERPALLLGVLRFELENHGGDAACDLDLFEDMGVQESFTRERVNYGRNLINHFALERKIVGHDAYPNYRKRERGA